MKKEGYHSKFGISQIRKGRFHELSIVKDCEGSDMDNLQERIVVLNYTCDTENRSDHSHIPLNYHQAKKLHDFLKDYIDEVYMYHEGKNEKRNN